MYATMQKMLLYLLAEPGGYRSVTTFCHNEIDWVEDDFGSSVIEINCLRLRIKDIHVSSFFMQGHAFNLKIRVAYLSQKE